LAYFFQGIVLWARTCRTPRWVLCCVRQLGRAVRGVALVLGGIVLLAACWVLVWQPAREQARQVLDAAWQTWAVASDVDGDLSDDGTWGDETPPYDIDNTADQEYAHAFTPQDDPAIVLAVLRRDFRRVIADNPRDLHLPGLSAVQFQALRRYLANKYRVARNVAGALVHAAFVVGSYRGVDPQLILAITAIESRYNPLAESHVGAQGLMQVMPRVHRDKFQALGLGVDAAVDPIPNMMIGTQIYQDCYRRRGSVARALACYVGATGPGDGGYGAKVLAEHQRIVRASGVVSALGE